MQELLERLGGMGYFHSYYIERACYEEMLLKNKLLKALEFSDWEIVPHLLCELEDCYDKENSHSLQFIEFIKFYFWQNLHFDPKGFEERLTDIMRITYPGFDLNFGENRILLDSTECLILNYMALFFIYYKEYEKAQEILVNLLIIIQKSASFLPYLTKTKAVVLNNIGLCKLHTKDLEDALEIINFATKEGAKEGGIYLYIKILRTRIISALKTNNYELLNHDLEFVKKGYKTIPKNLLRKKDYRAFMKEPKGLMFF